MGMWDCNDFFCSGRTFLLILVVQLVIRSILYGRSANCIDIEVLARYTNVFLPFAYNDLYTIDRILSCNLNGKNDNKSKKCTELHVAVTYYYFCYLYKRLVYTGLSTRNLIVTINRCRADHYNLVDSLAKVNIISDSSCTCKSSIQDLDHIIWQCPLYDNQRTKLIVSLGKAGFPLPMKTSIILHEPHVPGCKSIVAFLEECKIKL
ncbi:hypothetical protein TSAR_013165 [Trichomalopsis sarcophagae]|uniref:Uncharacterized protein n=1 Tax=Trichomalopsis sarcophagae TaxID=543379 RepID=A0A232EM66_9HYME|nr:hypothetical protein TSAR_013165 [Trichomalopsis sarcophagae]